MDTDSERTYTINKFKNKQLKSIKNESKTKFESIIKAALYKNNKSESKNELLSSQNSDDYSNSEQEIDDIKNSSSANIIEIKPPVPKPRTLKKHVEIKSQSDDNDSQITYTISRNSIGKTHSKYDTHDNRNENDKEIGDVLIHNNLSHHKVIVVSNSINSSPIVDKANIEYLSDGISQNKYSIISNLNTTLDNPSVTNTNSELIELKEIKNSNEKIDYDENVSSKRPIPKKRKKLQLKKEIHQISNDYKYENVVEITIFKADKLLLDSLVFHPIVKVHIVNINNGEYIRKSDKSRNVVFFYENKEFDFICPVLTHYYNLQENRSLIPLWNEKIILNEDYEYFLNQGIEMIIFFEIIDFVSFSIASNSRLNKKGWHKIAFAFLRPIVKNGSNFDKPLRLQLYYLYNNNNNNKNNKNIKKQLYNYCDLWDYWRKKKLKKYPSTLYVTIKSIKSPSKIINVLRSKTPIEGEGSNTRFITDCVIPQTTVLDNSLKKINHHQDNLKGIPGGKLQFNSITTNTTWTRLPHETCSLPNNVFGKLYSYDNGCFICKYSWNGLYLACALKIDEMYCIVIYSIITLEEINKFPCHQGIIYCIKWSMDDELILSASSDNTISIWNFHTSSFLQFLPHPSFVYTIDVSLNKTVASGTYDKVLRLWNYLDNEKTFHLAQELEGHNGYITSICFNRKSDLIYSADSIGMIIEWRKQNNNNWMKNRDIILIELRVIKIFQILLISKEKKIIIHSSDSIIRIVDLRNICVLYWLTGAQNRKIQTYFTLTPCGTFLLSGSENGRVNVWNIKTGREIASYNPYCDDITIINCVEFHPYDNILAISHYGDNLPILIYNFVKDFKGSHIILNYFNDGNTEILKPIKDCEKIPTEKNINNNLKGILKKMDTVIINLKSK